MYFNVINNQLILDPYIHLILWTIMSMLIVIAVLLGVHIYNFEKYSAK